MGKADQSQPKIRRLWNTAISRAPSYKMIHDIITETSIHFFMRPIIPINDCLSVTWQFRAAFIPQKLWVVHLHTSHSHNTIIKSSRLHILSILTETAVLYFGIGTWLRALGMLESCHKDHCSITNYFDLTISITRFETSRIRWLKCRLSDTLEALPGPIPLDLLKHM